MADEFDFTFHLTRNQAAALLKFLRLVGPADFERVLAPASPNDPSRADFEGASERLRVALRDKLEPGWAEEVLRELEEKGEKRGK